VKNISKREFWRAIKHNFYAQYNISVGPMAFEIIQKRNVTLRIRFQTRVGPVQYQQRLPTMRKFPNDLQ
jgi:hypothetical protein